MAPSRSTRKRKDSLPDSVYSPYFVSSERQAGSTDDDDFRAQDVPSRFFIHETLRTWQPLIDPNGAEAAKLPSKYRKRMAEPGFIAFSAAVLRAYHELYLAKPTLIQDYVSNDPWKLLSAVMLLNKTSGVHAVLTFLNLLSTWPTPYLLSRAPPGVLQSMISHLGLGNIRAKRLIDLSHLYITDPPRQDVLRPSRCKLEIYSQIVVDGREQMVLQTVPYPPTPVSHLPGCGSYALDSYRIFCMENEWKSVRPSDKELRLFLKWKWAVEELKQWDHMHGAGEIIDLEYIQDLTKSLKARWG